MPTYQYRCTQCGNELEAVQKFTDPSLTVCPECSGELRKVYSAVGVVFKGSGFYATDNRTKGRAKAASAGDSSSSSSESKSSESKSSESKSSDSKSSDSSSSKSDSKSSSSSSSSS